MMTPLNIFLLIIIALLWFGIYQVQKIAKE